MLEEHVTELLPGYAIGSLDQDELAQVTRHLPYCATCRGELVSYWETVDGLAAAVPLRSPRPVLKNKILNAAQKEVGRTVQGARERTMRGGFLRNLVSRASTVWQAAALLLLAALVVMNLFLWREVSGLRERVPEEVRLVQLQGSSAAPETHGYLMVFAGENYGTLVVEDAPVLEQDRQYQLWLIRDGKRTSGGVFSVNSQGYGVLQVEAEQPLNAYPAFGVTIEPAGGSPGPTGERVLGGEL